MRKQSGFLEHALGNVVHATHGETVADEVVDAVRSGRGTVRLPKRAAAFPWLTSTPQRIETVWGVGYKFEPPLAAKES